MSKGSTMKRPFINMTLTSSLKAKLKPCGKVYTCNECQKPFSRPSALKTHSYTHTGEKPHACDKLGCGRRFTVISNLRRHLRVHQQPHSRRRLTAQERKAQVERLIHKTVYDSLPSPPLSDTTFSPLQNDYYSPPASPLSDCLESTKLRFLKPKVPGHQRLCIRNLLN
ncbi:hypothetical protein BY458DRAFT_483591 [Sporodiniella umbellata]|nr:hypothetical protein BY458DRAFT_483591 [Sporodiniella umbellata]